jgi:monoamine oxidase
MGISRRDFLMRVGQAGGYSAAFVAMQHLGLMPMYGEQWKPIEAAPGSGKGVKVVVLGGGIGGLVSAYELRKLGYDVTVLEARERPGGRVWTGRKGTKVEFVDGTVQTIDWAEGNYQNIGAGRLPSTHWTILQYCRELGVPLEVEVNTTRSALLQNDDANGGVPVTQRKVEFDTRGQVSELLSKCIAQGALDQEFSGEDKDRMLTFLRSYGDLDKTGKFVGGSAVLGRAGWKIPPAAGSQIGVVDGVTDMKTLLDENFWYGLLYVDEWAQQATMMQPVGGMDKIPYAFAKSLGPIVQYSSPVKSFKKTAKGVSVTYTQGGAEKNIEAAYCIIALPFEILKKIDNDLAQPCKDSVMKSTASGYYKVSWESRRFWEQDYNIYGGLSYISRGKSALSTATPPPWPGPTPLWYPSANLMAETGVFVAGYMEEEGTPFATMTLEEKFAASRASVEKLHPGHGKECAKPIFFGWRHIKWNEASWIRSWGNGRAGYNALVAGDDPYYFAGDTVSNVNAWQEGAALSAKLVVQKISDKVKAARLAGAGDGSFAV